MAGVVDGRWRAGVWGGAGALLLLPMVLMLVSRDVNWGPGDFIAWAAMLGLAGLAFEGAMRLGRSAAMRWGLGAAVVLAFLLVWAELAVGLFGPG